MVTIKPAVASDCADILKMIRELAAFENLEDQVTATEEDLRNVLFEECVGRALIAKWDDRPAGYCLFFYNISTFKCKKGIYIEDIYVRPEYRGSGLGTWMLQAVGRLASEENCGRVEWACLDWNTKAQQFYTSMGAEKQPDWEIFRVDESKFPEFSTPKCSCSKS